MQVQRACVQKHLSEVIGRQRRSDVQVSIFDERVATIVGVPLKLPFLFHTKTHSSSTFDILIRQNSYLVAVEGDIMLPYIQIEAVKGFFEYQITGAYFFLTRRFFRGT